MTSSNGNRFPVTGHLCGEITVSPHKGQWRGALMFSLICDRINDRVKNREAGDMRRYRAHYDVIVMNLRRFQFTYNYLNIHIWNIGVQNILIDVNTPAMPGYVVPDLFIPPIVTSS